MGYRLAIRQRKSKQDFFWHDETFDFHLLDLKLSKRYWAADPFIYKRDNEVYVFYELFDYWRGRGVIAYSILKENYLLTKPKIVINESFHLSFPNIFDYNGETYIMPESAGDNCIQLYKCVQFPNKWIKAGQLVQTIRSCDSILLKKSNGLFLHTNVMGRRNCGHVHSCFVKNLIYKVDIPITCENEFGALDAVSCGEGDFGIRNAGQAFVDDGVLYRVGQDCRNGKYGFGICLFRVDSLSPYVEKFVRNINYMEVVSHVKGLTNEECCGFHTYNTIDGYEIIDLAVMDKIPRIYSLIKFIYMCFKNVIKIAKKILFFI